MSRQARLDEIRRRGEAINAAKPKYTYENPIDGETPLMNAIRYSLENPDAQRKALKLIKQLPSFELEKLSPISGRTPLTLVIEVGNLLLFEELMRKSPSIYVSYFDGNKETPLGVARTYSSVDYNNNARKIIEQQLLDRVTFEDDVE